MGDNFYTSPDVRNLPIMTGVVSFKPDGESNFRDLGYVDDLSISVTVETKDKKAARGGIIQTVFTALISTSATFKMTIAEITPDNASLFLLSSTVTNTDGSATVEMLSVPQPKGYLQFVGDNTFGPQISFTAYVTLGPAGDLSILSLNGDFSTLPVKGAINKDPVTNKFPDFNWALNRS